MTDRAPVLLLTRPRATSEAFLAGIEGRLGCRVQSVISPVLEIVDHGPLPDIGSYETLIFTSAHAVERLGRAALLAGRLVRTVGDATAATARSYGAEAEALGSDADSFLERAGSLNPPCLYCRGVHTRGDIAKRLRDRSIECDEAVVYDQREVPLTEEARTLLSSGCRILAPVFSPRSAKLLAGQIPKGATLEVFAISDAAASDWSAGGPVLVAERPTADCVMGLLMDAI